MAIDRFGRNIHYLRISLTDHCNLRCVYCMAEDMTFQPNADLMQDDEILTFTRLFAGFGFDKIRLTAANQPSAPMWWKLYAALQPPKASAPSP